MCDAIISGYEIRRVVDQNMWMRLVHLQDDRLRRHTLSVGAGDDPIGMYNQLSDKRPPGTDVRLEDLGTLKRFYTWKTAFSGIGVIRGHSITYSKKFGIQGWVFLEVDIPEVGTRNITARAIEPGRQEIITDTSDLEDIWVSTIEDARKQWTFGSIWPVVYNERTGKHELDDRSASNTPKPPLDTQSSGVVQPSAAR